MLNCSYEICSFSESEGVSGKIDVGIFVFGVLLVVLLYMMGMFGYKLIGLLVLVGMLFFVVLLKLVNVVFLCLQEGLQMVYKFFCIVVIYLIFFVVGVVIILWQELVNVFILINLLVIVSIVFVLVVIGFLVGKKIGMYLIDVVIVFCCQSGQGGIGDVVILIVGNCMSLMLFVQIVICIGGVINVLLGLLFFSYYLV